MQMENVQLRQNWQSRTGMGLQTQYWPAVLLYCSPKLSSWKGWLIPKELWGFRFLTRPCRLWVRRMHICSVYFFSALFRWATKGGPFISSLLLQPASICMAMFMCEIKIYVKKQKRCSYQLPWHSHLILAF